jgi:UDP-N-acetylglucosamine 2-epimerase (non-hydrolysing)
MHRPENVDDPQKIRMLAELIEQVSHLLPLVFPIHPRSAKNLSALLSKAHWDKIVANTELRLIDPLGYIDFLCLQKNACVMLTDSGGIQEETTVLGIPCLTLRENTERPITVTHGTNTVVGLDPNRVLEMVRRVSQSGTTPARPAKWDGKAAERIVRHLMGYFNCRPVEDPAMAHRPAPEVVV